MTIFANCVGRIQINHVSLADSDGKDLVRKRRFWFGWILIFVGNLAFRFRRVPLRVLHKAEWIGWERTVKLALRNETIPASTELLCEKIAGQPLSDVLCDLFVEETDFANKLAIIRLAVRALKGLHKTSIQPANGQGPAMLSHGDAAISNVLCCVDTEQVEWFDFDLRHDYRVSAVQRQADDLRSLLFSAGTFLPAAALRPLVEMVEQEYSCDGVWAALQHQVASGWFWLDLFHLSQTWRLRARYRIDGPSAAQSDKVLVDSILKTG